MPPSPIPGASLCSLSRAEWLGIAKAVAPQQSLYVGGLHDLLRPAAVLAAASPARTVDALPEAAEGAPFSVIYLHPRQLVPAR